MSLESYRGLGPEVNRLLKGWCVMIVTVRSQHIMVEVGDGEPDRMKDMRGCVQHSAGVE